MRSATIAAAFMAMASAVTAQTAGFAVFANPAQDEIVPAGKPYTLKWAAGDKYAGSAVLSLIGGETQGTQQFIANLTTLEVSANKYVWNVDCSLGKAKVYGLTITMVNEPEVFQWSQRFHIDNSGCAAGSSSSASASSSAPASVSSVYPTTSVPETSSTKAVTSATTTAAPSSSATPTGITAITTLTQAPAQTSSSTTKPTSSASQTTAGPSGIPTAAAPKVAVGSFALAGAVVAAALAL
ncbi:uncharacterized protein B0I36DRAFT_346749 [Microdochium trichocladiopsis]|uniref:Yeast cell wall synthesis Kre9/Knh1-like N-terminal domain-containing protein n=1 Tax=Microdochium trichocladiopsis TaxID=1682393 RepID=A0A9P9BSR7_9PEZI|nr:uncharacterized protein B0I36DRAFT_346749 [Microdochium trichocladiopsis]KAH7034874.1 hypothetical protein B0I36DRAFT_346749 [Microdochium trichocladiopsis]